MDSYIFECVFPYDPKDHNHDANYILIEPGDRLEVSTPFALPITGSMEEPIGWLRGQNITKGTNGCFPGSQYIRFISKRRNSKPTIDSRRGSIKLPEERPSPPEVPVIDKEMLLVVEDGVMVQTLELVLPQAQQAQPGPSTSQRKPRGGKKTSSTSTSATSTVSEEDKDNVWMQWMKSEIKKNELKCILLEMKIKEKLSVEKANAAE